MLEPYKGQTLLNIKKAQSLLTKIAEMIASDRYCMDIAQQCNSGLGLLRRANELILESHLISCGKKITSSDPQEKEKFIKEIVQLSVVASRK